MFETNYFMLSLSNACDRQFDVTPALDAMIIDWYLATVFILKRVYSLLRNQF